MSKPASNPLRLYQQTADRIAALIEKGEVKTGQRLPPERDLAVRFKVSRPVVREALVALELSGAIEVRTGSGAYVKPTVAKSSNATLKIETGPSAFELINARKLLEPSLAGQAALRRTEKDLAAIAQALRVFERHWKGTHWETLEADRVFHLAIAKAAHNERAFSIVENLWADMFGPIFAVLSERTKIANKKLITMHDHRTIFFCIQNGDARGVEAAMHTHLVHAEMKLLENGEVRKLVRIRSK
jgi:GntR family transcriptional regulator, uxu operon transcriptional repressor